MARFAHLLRSLNNLWLLAAVGRSSGDLASVGEVGVLAITAVPWEEGWERPLAEWRERLGIRRLADEQSDGLGAL